MTAPVRRRDSERRARACACGAALVAALLLGATVVAHPAAAQPAAVVGDGLDLELRSLTGVLHPGGRLAVELGVRNGGPALAEGLRLSATLAQPVVGRNALAQALDEGVLGGTWANLSAEVDPVAPQVTRTARLERDAVDLGLVERVERYGTYPLQVQLFADDVLADELTTAVVFVPELVDEPLRWTALLPVDAPPGRLVGGEVTPALLERLTAEGDLWTLARDLQAAAEDGDVAGVAIAASGRLLDEAADVADGATTTAGVVVDAGDRAARQAGAFVERLAGVLARPEVDAVALSYGPADLVALVRTGLDAEAVRLLAEDEAVLEATTGERPAPGVLWPPDGLDRGTLDVVRTAGSDVLVLEARYLRAGPPPNLTPAPSRRLRTAGGTAATALVPDERIGALLEAPDDDGAAATVQRIVAETAATYFERPFDPLPRGLLLAPPRGWTPAPGLVRALLAGLADAPWLRPVRLRALASGTAQEAGTASLAYPAEAERRELPASYLARLELARTALEPLASVLPDDDATPELFASDLLVAAAVHYRSPDLQPQGRARMDQVLEALTQLSGAVTVVETPPITLTSEVGQVPITLRSDAELPIRVHVRVSSSRFAFDEAEERNLELQPGVPVTITFTATALSPGGLWPVEVVVTDPAGTRVLELATLAVRSTAYPLVALLMTGGAGLFLLAWWAREIARRRRGKGGSAHRRRPAA